ncbi:MAG: c-type cytochrome [Gammaproteobacteria bacterium]|nr:c-type cytochrome [Gammaproteobacteria bacterium]
MRVVFVLFMLFFSLAACDFKREGADINQDTNASLYKLAYMNGCLECHRVSATVIGPSWEAIAERYKDASFDDAKAMLVKSVKEGSKGQYVTFKGGDGMPPLEKRVSSEHIEQLVEYILSLKR